MLPTPLLLNYAYSIIANVLHFEDFNLHIFEYFIIFLVFIWTRMCHVEIEMALIIIGNIICKVSMKLILPSNNNNNYCAFSFITLRMIAIMINTIPCRLGTRWYYLSLRTVCSFNLPQISATFEFCSYFCYINISIV